MKSIATIITLIILSYLSYSQGFNQKYEYNNDEIKYIIESNDTLSPRKHIIKISVYNKSFKNIFLADFDINVGEGIIIDNSLQNKSGLDYTMSMAKIKPQDSLVHEINIDSLNLDLLIFRSKYRKYFEVSFEFGYIIGIDEELEPDEYFRVEEDKIYLLAGTAFMKMKSRYFTCATIFMKN